MKVLHLISGGDRGGAMTHVLSLVGELNTAGDVRLLCLGDGPLARRAGELGLPHSVLPGAFFPGLAGVRAAVRESGAEPITFRTGAMTDTEREILLKGCLINYYRG